MTFSELAQHRIEIVTALFAGWSSGDANAPEPYWHPQGVLDDVANGRFEGWENIRDFFADGLSRHDDLRLEPQEFWENDGGLALWYDMSGIVATPDAYGPEYVGRRWATRCMSHIRFDGDRVVYEADFHDKLARRKSLGIVG